MAGEKNTVAGDAACPLCDHPVTVKVSATRHLYFTCPPPGDGGCGHQMFCRYGASDRKVAERVTRWRTPELRAEFIQAAEPAKAPAAPGRKPPAAPKGKAGTLAGSAARVAQPKAPAVPAEDREARARRELFGE